MHAVVSVVFASAVLAVSAWLWHELAYIDTPGQMERALYIKQLKEITGAKSQ